ncbi:hypothetical protein CCR75_007052 [Bremia lactucae]|uniref:Uncharacterized protein n=1 Tax=Bremia lactucae TaxID=4779 RepID=A0A976IGE9_BRELC|nr:hypothetical protein CCR75_007052 [Bremia lactucae]
MEVEHEKRIKPSTTVASTRPEMVFKVESVDCSFDTESSVESKHDLKADDADFKDKTGVKSKELELDIIKDLTKTDDGATKANNSEFVKLEGAFAASKNTDVRDQAPKETADSNEASGTIDMPGATDVVKIDALIAK